MIIAAAAFFPYNVVSPVSNQTYVSGRLKGYQLFPEPPMTQGLISFFFFFATVPAKKPYFMRVHHVHTATPCLSPYPQLYAQLTVVMQLSFPPRFRTGCSAYLLDYGVQHFPLICVFVPIMIVMEPPLNMTGPNSQTPQAGVRKVFHLEIVVFKVLSLYGLRSTRVCVHE